MVFIIVTIIIINYHLSRLQLFFMLPIYLLYIRKYDLPFQLVQTGKTDSCFPRNMITTYYLH